MGNTPTYLELKRRRYLALAGLGTTGTLAGCSSGASDSDDEQPRSDADTLLSIRSVADLDDLPWNTNIVARLDGSGSSVTEKFDLEPGLAVLVYENESGEGIWGDVEHTDGDDRHIGAINEVIVDEDVDRVSGADVIAAKGGTYLIDVDTEDEWQVQVVQPSAPDEEIRTLPVSASGENSAVLGPVEVDGGMTVRGDHASGDLKTTFNVEAVPESASDSLDSDWAFTEDAGFEGESWVDVDGTTWISVRTRGEWSLEFDE